jgi:membrane dipeptidase
MKHLGERLQREAFVFDFVPMEPFVDSARSRGVMFDGIKRGHAASRILGDLHEDRLEELKMDHSTRDAVKHEWAAAGVKAIQITLGAHRLEHASWDGWIKGLGYWHRRVQAAGDMTICLSADDLEAAWRNRKIGVLLGTQEAGPIGADLWKLDALYGLGLRVLQLTYNSRNALGDGCTEPAQAGLTELGYDVIDTCNDLGIIVDVSHTGYVSTLDAIHASRAPVAVTHSCCRKLFDHPRAKSDEQLRALAAANGYIGIVAVPFFLAASDANLDTMIDHVVHAAEIMGCDRVGIATDWGGWTPDLPSELAELSRQEFLKLGFDDKSLPEFRVSLPEFSAWRQWPRITGRLLERGFSEGEVRGLVGSNWLSFMRRAI